jgi:PTS system galactitol-specific IIB component
MPKRARILFVCGTGIATSTAAENKCINALEGRGYSLTTSQCIAQAVTQKAASFNPHVIVTTTKLNLLKEVLPDGKTVFYVDGVPGIPAFNGVPFLTTIGVEELIQNIAEAIDNSEKP